MRVKKYSVYYIILLSIAHSALESQGVRDLERFQFARIQRERAVPSQSVNRGAELIEPNTQSLKDFQNTNNALDTKNFEGFEDFESFKEFEEFIDQSPAPDSDQSPSIWNSQDALNLINQKVIENLKRNASLQQPAETGLSKIQKTQKMPVRERVSQSTSNAVSESPTATLASALNAQQAFKQIIDSNATKRIQKKQKDLTFHNANIKYPCPICNKDIGTFSGLKKHMIAMHKVIHETPETMSAQYRKN